MNNQVRWNCIPQEYEEASKWFFVIINSNERESQRIRNRVIRQVGSIEDYPGSIAGKVKNFYYQIMSFLSHRVPEKVNWDKIFKKPRGIKEDQDLYERLKTGKDGLEAYVKRALESGRF